MTTSLLPHKSNLRLISTTKGPEWLNGQFCKAENTHRRHVLLESRVFVCYLPIVFFLPLLTLDGAPMLRF